jgi:excisionase family DNA binding protein
MTTTDKERLLTLNQAAAFLNLSRSKVYRLMGSGDLPFVKLGKSRRVSMSALLTLIEAHTLGTAIPRKPRGRRAH